MSCVHPLRRVVLPCLLATLAGCAAVGPDYSGAPPAAADKLPAFVRAGDAPVTAEAPSSTWWKALGDPVLDHLVEHALAANIDIDVATARLQQARAAMRLERANDKPSASASALYAHARLPDIDIGNVDGNEGRNVELPSQLNLYSLGVDASWEIDLFGGRRRANEVARASAEAAHASLQDVQVSLTADVANAYVNLRDRQRRERLLQESIALQRQMIELTRQRFDRGTAAELDVVRLDDQLESSRAQLQGIGAERESYLNQIATLLGEAPGAEDAALATPAGVPLPPASIDVGDPAALLRRRPDIRAAERTLAADTARIGQAEAAKYPSLKLFGIIGLGGTSPSDLTHLDDFTAVLAPMLSWNFLDVGRNEARVGQAEQVRNEAQASYRRAVLNALLDAENSLSRFRHGRLTVAASARSKQSADRAVALLSQRYQAGTVTLIDLLDATRRQRDADQNLSQAEAELTRSFVAIQKSLGLGWT
ncbi:efflux transporter outer membrane subunit [soil metagenome]